MNIIVVLCENFFECNISLCLHNRKHSGDHRCISNQCENRHSNFRKKGVFCIHFDNVISKLISSGISEKEITAKFVFNKLKYGR